MENLIQTLATHVLPVIFAITLHEAAHGYAARHFGDPTAWQLGRISANPLRHIDPVGTILVPALILLFSGGGFIFGWAKPVPVDFGRLRNPKRDMLWVAAAGPAANLAMLAGWILLAKFGFLYPDSMYAEAAQAMGRAGIMINASLMLLNLLPLPPLDGGRIMVSLLPNRLAWRFAQIEPYGFIILLVLMFTHVLNAILLPLLLVLLSLLSWVFNLNLVSLVFNF
ncbi:MAG TPA: site-2 protease family protein [Rhodocyclaceae bacterium]|jgi:Zn-dependent protease|nr:site-2 protease family protein [Rhodocyclaceae bacterium]